MRVRPLLPPEVGEAALYGLLFFVPTFVLTLKPGSSVGVSHLLCRMLEVQASAG